MFVRDLLETKEPVYKCPFIASSLAIREGTLIATVNACT